MTDDFKKKLHKYIVDENNQLTEIGTYIVIFYVLSIAQCALNELKELLSYERKVEDEKE